jgi:hypothetical protein
LTTGAKIVTFDSNGGNILAAIAYGRVIRALGLSTFELRSAQCASACALAFMGGVVRKAEPGSIGVHQASFSDGAINGQAATAAVQSMTALIMSYLIEMGVDPRLLQLSLSVPSSDMRYLTTQEMDDYKVTTGGELELADVSTIAHPTPSAASAETSIKPAPPQCRGASSGLHGKISRCMVGAEPASTRIHGRRLCRYDLVLRQGGQQSRGSGRQAEIRRKMAKARL